MFFHRILRVKKKLGEIYKDYKIEKFEISLKQNNVVEKVFELNINTSGSYYISFIFLPIKDEKGYKNLVLKLDDSKNSVGKIKCNKDSWQSSGPIGNAGQKQSVYLSQGLHHLSFTFGDGDIPMIESLSLSLNQLDIEDKAKPINEYIFKLGQKKLPDSYQQQKDNQKGLRVLANPGGYYTSEIDADYSYTTFITNYYNAGQIISIQTRSSNCDPVLYLFNLSNPALGSWSNDDSNGTLESTITTRIQYSGTYFIAIRSYNSQYPGVTQLWINNVLSASNLPVAGKFYDASNSFAKSGVTLNHFTSNLKTNTGGLPDTWMCVMPSRTGPVSAFNDDYFQSGGGDFQWGRSSRIKTSSPMYYALISAFNSNFTPATCDIYMNMEFMTVPEVFSMFPSLKKDDAILSGPVDEAYNCYAWAGGMTNRVLTTGEEADVWNAPTQLQIFDNFFGNTPPRYSGAWTYTRNGATADNAVIALWGYQAGNYSHASVRKPGNDHPHGFDWESKNGTKVGSKGIRFMHPKNALASLDYGNILEYYSYTGTNAMRVAGHTQSPISLEESLAKGYSVMDKTELSPEEETKLLQLISSISLEDKNKFNDLYRQWKRSIAGISSPDTIKKTKEFLNIKMWINCKGKIIHPLLFEKFFEDTEARYFIREVTFPLYKKYYDQIILNAKNPKNWYNKSGSYLIPTPENTCVKYIKSILSFYEVKEDNKVVITNEQLTVFPNPTDNLVNIEFHLSNPSRANLFVTDSKGKFIASILNNNMLESGKHTYIWAAKGNSTGIYLIKLITDQHTQTFKISLTK